HVLRDLRHLGLVGIVELPLVGIEPELPVGMPAIDNAGHTLLTGLPGLAARAGGADRSALAGDTQSGVATVARISDGAAFAGGARPACGACGADQRRATGAHGTCLALLTRGAGGAGGAGESF